MKAKALTKLTRNMDWKWAEEQELAFQSLKAMLASAPVLALETDDREFKVEADASGTGIVGIWLLSFLKPAMQCNGITRFMIWNSLQL